MTDNLDVRLAALEFLLPKALAAIPKAERDLIADDCRAGLAENGPDAGLEKVLELLFLVPRSSRAGPG